MEFSYTINATVTNKQVALRVWMILNAVTFSQIGEVLGGMTSSGAQMALRRQCILSDRYELLRLTYPGFPPELLPEPKDEIKSGPKPK